MKRKIEKEFKTAQKNRMVVQFYWKYHRYSNDQLLKEAKNLIEKDILVSDTDSYENFIRSIYSAINDYSIRDFIIPDFPQRSIHLLQEIHSIDDFITEYEKDKFILSNTSDIIEMQYLRMLERKKLELMNTGEITETNMEKLFLAKYFTKENAEELSKGKYYIFIDGATREIKGIIDCNNKLYESYNYFEICSDFYDNIALFSVNDNGTIKYGYISITGEVIIEPKYTKARDFQSGYAAVYTRDKKGNYAWNFIDKAGQLLLKNGYENVSDFIGEYAIVYEYPNNTSKCGVINNKGNIIIPCQYYQINNISEGLVCYKDYAYGSFGYINLKNEIIIKPSFEYAFRFSEGLAFVKFNNVDSSSAFAFIDKNGEKVMNFPVVGSTLYYGENLYDQYYIFSEGLCAVYDGVENKYGYINRDGDWIIEPLYRSAFAFKNGVAVVERKPREYYIIDKNGNKVEDSVELTTIFYEDYNGLFNGKNELIAGNGNYQIDVQLVNNKIRQGTNVIFILYVDRK